MHTKKGFTLVELLVVISIMAILTVITVSQFATAQKKARDVQRKGDTSAVSKALLMYFNDYGVFPEALNGRITVMVSGVPAEVAWGDEFAQDGYIYMKTTPKETSTPSVPYCYKVSSDHKKMGVFANLENVQDGDYDKQNPAKTAYSCNGNDIYHFAIFSPNANYGDLDK